MRLGIFGGSFDPVHRGHLRLAESAWRQLDLQQIQFLPTRSQPLKPSGPAASDRDRVTMLRLATAQRDEFDVSQREIDRGGTSYTVDTLREINAELPQAKLYFLMGADSLADLPQWKQPDEICRLAIPAVVRRGGAPAPDFAILKPLATDERLAEIRAAQIEMPEMLISSSVIRARIAEGEPWEHDVLPAVAEYIREQQLYR